VTAPVTARSPVELLEPHVRSRLHPLETTGWPNDVIRSDFDLHQHLRPEASAAPTPAAVLVALVQREAGLTVILTRRSDDLRRHSGQIALPGGRCDPGETPAETALREAEEEIGLDRRFVRLAGLGDPYDTVTNFRVLPVVGFVSPGFSLRADPHEVAEVFETPFDFLMDVANHEEHERLSPDGNRRRFFAMSHDDRMIWGATAGVLRALSFRLFGSPA